MHDPNSNSISESDIVKIKSILNKCQKHFDIKRKKRYQLLAMEILQQIEFDTTISAQNKKKELPNFLKQIKDISILDTNTPFNYTTKIQKVLRGCDSCNLINWVEGDESPLVIQFNDKYNKDTDSQIMKNKSVVLSDICAKLEIRGLTVYSFKKFVIDQEAALSIRRSGLVKTLNALFEKMGFGKDFFKTKVGIEGVKLANNIHSYFGKRGREDVKVNPICGKQLPEAMRKKK